MLPLADPAPPPHHRHHPPESHSTPSDADAIGAVGDVAGFGDLLSWQPNVGWLAVALVLATAYLTGVAALASRGDAWPVGRTVSWLLGLGSLVSVTCTGLAGYASALFSVHMAQHMVLSMLTPILLLLAAPITLALRALPSRGHLRRGLLSVLHSRFARLISHPGITVSAFVVSLFGLYFTELLDVAMRSHVGHQLMLIHFLAVGLLFLGRSSRSIPGRGATRPDSGWSSY
jgi:cytochrome c oxidase assembly factor CtaG